MCCFFFRPSCVLDLLSRSLAPLCFSSAPETNNHSRPYDTAAFIPHHQLYDKVRKKALFKLPHLYYDNPKPEPEPEPEAPNQNIMFARRILKNSSLSPLSTPNTLLRAFTTSSASFKRSPALSDITPEGVASFDAKQKEFREQIADQSKKKEAAASQSAEPSTSSPLSFNSSPTAPRASNARSSASNTQNTHAIDSQSVSAAETTTTQDDSAKGKLSSLIYGTKEGREMDKEMEHSFSQVLARGKYVHSIVFHEVKSDKVDEYVELVGSWYPRMAGMPENKVHLVGSWRTEVGDCDTFGKPQRPR